MPRHAKSSPPPSDADQTTPEDALADVLKFPSADGLSENYDLLRLLGAVIGHVSLLRAALDPSDPEAAVSAARALASLKEDPADIAERLKSGPFRDLTTADLRTVVEKVNSGIDVRVAMREAMEERQQREGVDVEAEAVSEESKPTSAHTPDRERAKRVVSLVRRRKAP